MNNTTSTSVRTTSYDPAHQMDAFDMTDLASVSQQSLLFGSFPQPTQIKRQQSQKPYPPSFSVPLYSPIEDFDFSPDFATESNPSLGSPLTPNFSGFSLPSEGDDWVEWDNLAQSPESDDFLTFKNEADFDTPDLSSIPIMTPELIPLDLSNVGTGLEDSVVFGREGVNDTKPLFQSPQMNFTMPPQRQQQQQQSKSSVPSPLNTEASPIQSLSTSLPTETERRYPARATNLKRKSSECSSTSSSPRSARSSCSPPPHHRRHTTSASTPKEEIKATLGPKKTAHNMIEKRYRTNLNDKIAALRDSVPALRVMVHRLEQNENGCSGEDGEDEDARLSSRRDAQMSSSLDSSSVGLDLGGLAPAHKLNKATILSKATEYIAHLERQNRSLIKENSALRNRVEGFEMLVMNRNSTPRGQWN